jgi:class 3 adenylate cyclase/tetratricopeptide (TPR) repeat protein
MIRYIPPFILQNYEQKQVHGYLDAYLLLFDIVNFTGINVVLQKEGKQGAEELSRFLDNVFQQPLELVHKYGGFVSGFAGDAFCAVFPDAQSESITSVVNSISKHFRDNPVYKTAFGEFALQVRQTVCYGSVEWQIYRNELQNEYVFLGRIMQELTELSLQKTEVIFSETAARNIGREKFSPEGNGFSLQDDPVAVVIPGKTYHYSRETLLSFCHPTYREVIPQNEIRTAAFCFASLEKVDIAQREQTIASIHKLAAKYGGFVNRLDDTDKGLVALLLFGLPHSEDKTLERICSFALETAESNADIALGISCGSVFAGKFGSGDFGEYTAFGHPVNIAARLMSKARAGEVLTDIYLWQEMQDHYDFNYLGSLNLKGIDFPVRYYRLSRQTQDLTRHQENRFVGRDDELFAIRTLLDKSIISKENTIIYVSGDAGIGKSRLVKEALSTYPTTAYHKFYITCDAILSKPLEAIKQIVRTYFYYNQQLPEEAGIAMFRGLWTALAQEEVELQRIESIIASLLGYEWQGSVWCILPPEEKPKQLKNAFIKFLEQLTKTKPVLIHLDDAQWLDEQSKEYLQEISLKEIKPVVIIAPCRYLESGNKVDLELTNHKREDIDLNSLSDEGSAELIKTILRLEQVPEDTLSLITSRAMGNPFFLEQLSSFLMESGSINDKGVVTGEVSYLSSFSISDIVGSRIDRLTENVKECMFNASVLGTEFNIKVLSQMLESEPVTELESGVKNRIWKDLDELRYIFTHILIKDIVYQRMMSEKLQKLHQTAAEALEIVFAEKLYENAEEIAHHFEKGNKLIKAAEYYDKAGINYRNKYNYPKAELNLNKALQIKETALGAEHPDTADTLQILANIHFKNTKFSEAEELYLRTLEIREKTLGSEHPDVAESLEDLACVYRFIQKETEAESLCQRALEINIKAFGEEHPATVRSLNSLSLAEGKLHKEVQYEEHILRALEICDKYLGAEHEAGINPLHNLACIYSKKGKYEEAEALYLQVFERLEKLYSAEHCAMTVTIITLAYTHIKLCKYDQAESLFLRALEVRERTMGPEHRYTLEAVRGLAYLYGKMEKPEKAREYQARLDSAQKKSG